MVIWGEASPDLDVRLIDRIGRLGRQIGGGGGRWDVSVGATAGMASFNLHRKAPDDADRAATLYGALRDLADAGAGTAQPTLVLIDELQAIREDTLGAITSVVNERAGHAHPLVLVTAELPNRLDLDHLTYFRDRAQQLTIGYLDAKATRDAIAIPARQLGVRWDPDALDAIAAASRGYPYAVQVYAHATWRAAGTGDHIDLHSAEDGRRRGLEQMSRLYRSRWESLPPRLQQYMGALAHISPEDDAVVTSTVPAALHDAPAARSRDLATLRDRHGAVIHARGRVRPSLPGWGRWIIALQQREPFLDLGVVERAEEIRRRGSLGA